jgi:hypothetical protein
MRARCSRLIVHELVVLALAAHRQQRCRRTGAAAEIDHISAVDVATGVASFRSVDPNRIAGSIERQAASVANGEVVARALRRFRFRKKRAGVSRAGCRPTDRNVMPVTRIDDQTWSVAPLGSTTLTSHTKFLATISPAPFHNSTTVTPTTTAARSSCTSWAINPIQ